MTDDLAKLKAFLSDIAIFGGLEEHTLDRVVSMLVKHSFEAGAVVFREGDPGTSMYLVHSGEVLACRSSEGGKQVHMTRLGPGEIFGEMTLIDIQPRPATVTVERPTVLYSLTNRDLYRLYREDMPGYVMVIQNLCREMSRRLRRADSRIANVAEATGDDTTQICAPLPRRRKARP